MKKQLTQTPINMSNTKQNNMNSVQYKPEGQFKEMGVTFKAERRGRPIDPNSVRQQRLKSAPGKRTGRPVDPNSARQQRLALMEAKIAANGGKKIGRGRPAGTVNVNSARQIALRAAGDANAIASFEAATGKTYKAEVAK